MKKSHPKSNPQTWANEEHLLKIAAEKGPDASADEYEKIFSPGGKLPPIEKRHREKAAAYNRWHPGPSAKQQDATAPTSAPQSATK